uniref:transposase n=1 Tax=Candidatus Protochlamydia sp. R18 TaxID=1353977 RepID=UPI0005A8B546
SKKTKYLLEQAGCKILFLPSYSPDLNPIEVFWANFKQLVQLNLNKLSNLAKAIDYSFCQICI